MSISFCSLYTLQGAISVSVMSVMYELGRARVMGEASCEEDAERLIAGSPAVCSALADMDLRCARLSRGASSIAA